MTEATETVEVEVEVTEPVITKQEATDAVKGVKVKLKGIEQAKRIVAKKADMGVDITEEADIITNEQAKLEVELDEANEALLKIHRAEKEIIAAGVRDQIAEEAAQISIDMSWLGDDQDQILRIIGGFAGSLQFLDVNGESYYESVQASTYNKDGGTKYATNPELKEIHEARFNALRDQRWHLKVLRRALEDKFDEEMLKLDTSNMSNPPVHLFRSDAAVRLAAQERQEKKVANIRQENAETRQAAREAWALAEGVVL